MCYAYAFQDMSPKNLPTQYQLVQLLSLNKSINFNMQSYLKTDQYPTESFIDMIRCFGTLF